MKCRVRSPLCGARIVRLQKLLADNVQKVVKGMREVFMQRSVRAARRSQIGDCGGDGKWVAVISGVAEHCAVWSISI